VALSFYKIFGFPNIGALIVRKDSQHVLESRRYFGGGTVEMVIAVNDTWHAKKETSIHDRLEDGTLPFHSIFALDHAMNVHERLYGPNPMKFISHHTAQLGKQTYDGLSAMTHSNGRPICCIYKDVTAAYGDPSVQGATVAFNVTLADGTLVGFADVEEAADARNIYVRSGSLCNPGGVATYLSWSPAEMKAAHAAGHRCTNPTQLMFGKPTGVVRVSLGAMSTASDVQILLRFIRDTYTDKHGLASAATPQSQSLSHPIPHDPSTPLGSTSNPLYALPQIPTNNNPPRASTSLPRASANLPRASPSELNLWEKANPALSAPDQHQQQQQQQGGPPPFVAADYIHMRKPWEEAMRKHATQYAANTLSMEIKVRELEDASLYTNASGGAATPSVKARRFGRSVVNMLRTKSSIVDAR